MTRIFGFPCLKLTLGILFLLPGLCSTAVAAPARPNVMILLCDDLGYGDLACFGHPLIKTPNLDQLARDGMRLTQCYAAAPVCSPSRAGMLAGRIPNRLGIYDWIPAGSPMHLQVKEVTFATLLKKVGYRTCHVGKWHCNGLFNSPQQPQPGDHGFDHWFSTQNNAAPNHMNPTNFVRNGKAVGPVSGYSSQVIVDEALAWLDGSPQDQPFCLLVWFHSPHEIVATGESFTNLYPDVTPREKAEYFGNISQMDHEVGRLLRWLDDKKLRDNTLVFFTSDNGPETLNRYRGATRSHGSPGPFRGMKLHLYEGGIRVPGILRWPGYTKPGQVCPEPICGTDLLPTLCAITAAPLPEGRAIDGTSFLPIFEGKPIVRRAPLYWQYDRALGGPKIALRQGDYKLLADARLEKLELYHLKEDERETVNLADREPDRLKSLLATMKRLHDEIAREGPQWPQAAPKP